MRPFKRSLALATVLVIGSLGFAGEPAKEDKPDARLATVLRDWEKAANGVREIHYYFTETVDDRAFQTKDVTTGQVFYKKPDLVRIDWKPAEGEPRQLLLQGRKVHLFSARDKVEVIYPLPKEIGFPEHPERYPKDKGLVLHATGAFLEGMAFGYLALPVDQLKQSCAVRLKSQDEDWIVLELEPRGREMKADFIRMQVTLHAKVYQLRRLWFEQGNGNTVRLDVEKAVINPKDAITPKSIREGLPQGYKQIEYGKSD
jgi:outer membrane lipoprotein-sorting protein